MNIHCEEIDEKQQTLFVPFSSLISSMYLGNITIYSDRSFILRRKITIADRCREAKLKIVSFGFFSLSSLSDRREEEEERKKTRRKTSEERA